jgi:hypothetical protein
MSEAGPVRFQIVKHTLYEYIGLKAILGIAAFMGFNAISNLKRLKNL